MVFLNRRTSSTPLKSSNRCSGIALLITVAILTESIVQGFSHPLHSIQSIQTPTSLSGQRPALWEAPYRRQGSLPFLTRRTLLSLRGGEQQQGDNSSSLNGTSGDATSYASSTSSSSSSTSEGATTAASPSEPESGCRVFSTMIVSQIAAFGKWYEAALVARPILTKSVTSGIIFGISDYLAQRVEQRSGDDKNKSSSSINWTRTWYSVAVGLFYFGPAAHAWYDMIFRVFPGTGLVSTLQKAAMGQLIFGPSFTCIFFGVSLLQSGTFTPGNWFRKIKQDLPGSWLAGIGYWPLVDLISYSLIAPKWIPLFINMCSLVWTIYLSLVANRKTN